VHQSRSAPSAEAANDSGQDLARPPIAPVRTTGSISANHPFHRASEVLRNASAATDGIRSSTRTNSVAWGGGKNQSGRATGAGVRYPESWVICALSWVIWGGFLGLPGFFFGRRCFVLNNFLGSFSHFRPLAVIETLEGSRLGAEMEFRGHSTKKVAYDEGGEG
jgi:hypothetical protein